MRRHRPGNLRLCRHHRRGHYQHACRTTARHPTGACQTMTRARIANITMWAGIAPLTTSIIPIALIQACFSQFPARPISLRPIPGRHRNPNRPHRHRRNSHRRHPHNHQPPQTTASPKPAPRPTPTSQPTPENSRSPSLKTTPNPRHHRVYPTPIPRETSLLRLCVIK